MLRQLASTYHWTYAELLSLTVRMRRFWYDSAVWMAEQWNKKVTDG